MPHAIGLVPPSPLGGWLGSSLTICAPPLLCEGDFMENSKVIEVGSTSIEVTLGYLVDEDQIQLSIKMLGPLTNINRFHNLVETLSPKTDKFWETRRAYASNSIVDLYQQFRRLQTAITYAEEVIVVSKHNAQESIDRLLEMMD